MDNTINIGVIGPGNGELIKSLVAGCATLRGMCIVSCEAYPIEPIHPRALEAALYEHKPFPLKGKANHKPKKYWRD